MSGPLSLADYQRISLSLVSLPKSGEGLDSGRELVAREEGFASWAALSEAFLNVFLGAVRDRDRERTLRLAKDFPAFVTARIESGCWQFEGVPTQGDSSRSCQALHHCAVRGYAEVAEILLEQGADPNASGFETEENHGVTFPVVLAAWEGDLATLRVLLEHGADPNAAGGAAMKTALAHRAFDKVDLLLANGAEVDIVTAAGLGRVEELESLVSTAANLSEALAEAVRQNQVDSMKVLLGSGKKLDLEAPFHWGMSPLQLAAYYGASDAAKLLFEYSVDVDAIKSKSQHGWDVTGTALHMACAPNMANEEQALRTVDALLGEGADSSIGNADGQTALDLARAHGRERLVGRLSAR